MPTRGMLGVRAHEAHPSPLESFFREELEGPRRATPRSATARPVPADQGALIVATPCEFSKSFESAQ
jgi:hypothetical protein